jgi:hypothetical protein
VDFAYSQDFLEHLNFKLGQPTARGLNTLVPVTPEPINTTKLALGLSMAQEEEQAFLKARQLNPSHQRTLHGWEYPEGMRPQPKNPAEYQRAYELAASLSKSDVAKLIGGYGGERGDKPTGAQGLELATDALYNASYGIDTLTGAPLNYKQNAGHLYDFAKHGQGPTRPEQARVNKVTQEFDGMQKLNLLDETIEDVNAAQLYANHPEEMEALLNELPSSSRESKGWKPELDKMRANASRWHMR